VKPRRPPEVCPVCDADVPDDAKACPNCGACYDSGWRDDDYDTPEEIDYDILDLPDEVLDDEDRRARDARNVKRIIPPKWRWVALALVVMWGLWFWWKSGWCRLW
jgi:hypothetical protein